LIEFEFSTCTKWEILIQSQKCIALLRNTFQIKSR